MIEKDEQKYNADTELSSIPEVTPIELLPCPFCGAGETQFHEMMEEIMKELKRQRDDSK